VRLLPTIILLIIVAVAVAVAVAVVIVIVIVESGPPLIPLLGHSPDRDLPLSGRAG